MSGSIDPLSSRRSAREREDDHPGEPGVDLSSCDREPIHLIGAIQPHGALIASQSGLIRQVSQNCGALLGKRADRLIGTPLCDLLAPGTLADLSGGEETDPALPDPIRLGLRSPRGGRGVDCLCHRSRDWLVLELLEPCDEPGGSGEEASFRHRIIAELVRHRTLPDLARAAATVIREVTGFDRVMVYRFDDDQHGEVIAEDTDLPDSYLGLHYPASDIPEPARRHFLLNAVRAIPNATAAPVPLVAAQGAGPADLTRSLLRAVAPVHLEYMRNMGVRASLSLSLIIEGRLWGLIACHHRAPRALPLGRLQLAGLLGATISALVEGVEARARLRRQMAAEKLAMRMEQAGQGGAPLAKVVQAHGAAIMRLTGTQGLLLRQAGRSLALGTVPEPPLDWVSWRGALHDGIALTDRLSAVLPMDTTQRQVAAGAASLDLSEDGRDCLVLLREPWEHTIRWGGRPDKVDLRDGDGAMRIGPRRSFEVWREERVGRSRSFGPGDREALRIMRRALVAVASARREQEAVLARRLAEAHEHRLRLELTHSARQGAMRELAGALAHELAQPLAAVGNYVGAIREHLRRQGNLQAPVEALADGATGEVARAADLVRRLRDFVVAGALEPEPTDLNAVIAQSVELALLAGDGPRPAVSLRLANDMPDVFADPVQIGQVVLNLVRNAVQAMRAAPVRELIVQTRCEGRQAVVTVSDTGPGIDPELRGALFEPKRGGLGDGMGIGLSLCRSIVEAHGGTMSETAPPAGAEFVLTLPIDGTDHAA